MSFLSCLSFSGKSGLTVQGRCSSCSIYANTPVAWRQMRCWVLPRTSCRTLRGDFRVQRLAPLQLSKVSVEAVPVRDGMETPSSQAERAALSRLKVADLKTKLKDLGVPSRDINRLKKEQLIDLLVRTLASSDPLTSPLQPSLPEVQSSHQSLHTGPQASMHSTDYSTSNLEGIDDEHSLPTRNETGPLLESSIHARQEQPADLEQQPSASTSEPLTPRHNTSMGSQPHPSRSGLDVEIKSATSRITSAVASQASFVDVFDVGHESHSTSTSLPPLATAPAAALCSSSSSSSSAAAAAAAAEVSSLAAASSLSSSSDAAAALSSSPSSPSSPSPTIAGESAASDPSQSIADFEFPPNYVPPPEGQQGISYPYLTLTKESLHYAVVNPNGLLLTFLGTGTETPTLKRGASCLVLLRDRDVWMFDCGEDSQRQLLLLRHVRSSKLYRIFISEMTNQALLGLPGMLCTISASRAKGHEISDIPVHLYGPPGLATFVSQVLLLSDTYLEVPIIVHELLPTAVTLEEQEPMLFNQRARVFRALLPPDQLNPLGYTDVALDRFLPTKGRATLTKGRTSGGGVLTHDKRGAFRPMQFPLPGDANRVIDNNTVLTWSMKMDISHKVTAVQIPKGNGSDSSDGSSFAYVVEEAPKAGALFVDRCAALNVPPGKSYGMLKSGYSVSNRDGQIITPDMVTGAPAPGRKVVILGSSSDPWKMGDIGNDADVLVVANSRLHESDEGAGISDVPSTATAARFAKDSKARFLIFGRTAPGCEPKDVILSASPHYPGPMSIAWDGYTQLCERHAGPQDVPAPDWTTPPAYTAMQDVIDNPPQVKNLPDEEQFLRQNEKARLKSQEYGDDRRDYYGGRRDRGTRGSGGRPRRGGYNDSRYRGTGRSDMAGTRRR